MKKHHAGSLSGSKNHSIITRLWWLAFSFFCYIKALSGIPYDLAWPCWPVTLLPFAELLPLLHQVGDSRCRCSSKAFGDGMVSTQLRCTPSSLLVVFLPVLHPHMTGRTVRSVPQQGQFPPGQSCVRILFPARALNSSPSEHPPHFSPSPLFPCTFLPAFFPSLLPSLTTVSFFPF